MQLRFSKPWFRDEIEKKIKNLSIREMWSNGGGIPEIGETLYLKDGNRFVKAGMPGCLKPILVDGKNPVCTGVWPVEIKQDKKRNSVFIISTDFFKFLNYMSPLRYSENSLANCSFMKRFAKMDGWNSFSEMIEFFRPRLPLDAFIIYWGKR